MTHFTHFIHTNSGAKFVFSGEGAQVRIEDVAHHLSNVARFGGATDHHYSVGYHSLVVERILSSWDASPKLRLRGLLHDAHEGFMGGDFPTPFQDWLCEHVCDGVNYLEKAKEHLDTVIFRGLGVDVDVSDEDMEMLKRADKTAFIIEAEQVFKDKPAWLGEYAKRFELYDIPSIALILPTDPHYIRNLFVLQYHSIRAEMLLEVA